MEHPRLYKPHASWTASATVHVIEWSDLGIRLPVRILSCQGSTWSWDEFMARWLRLESLFKMRTWEHHADKRRFSRQSRKQGRTSLKRDTVPACRKAEFRVGWSDGFYLGVCRGSEAQNTQLRQAYRGVSLPHGKLQAKRSAPHSYTGVVSSSLSKIARQGRSPRSTKPTKLSLLISGGSE